jgi:hypothetical protein
MELHKRNRTVFEKKYYRPQPINFQPIALKIMNKIFLIMLVFSAFGANGQNKTKADSAYYLLDTAKTIPSDRLWHTYKQGIVKFYELDIYALYVRLMDKPTFAYSSRFQQPIMLSREQLKLLKISSLSQLILKLKQFAEEDRSLKNEDKKPFYLYIIEPKTDGFTMVKTQLDGSGKQTIVN